MNRFVITEAVIIVLSGLLAIHLVGFQLITFEVTCYIGAFANIGIVCLNLSCIGHPDSFRNKIAKFLEG